MSLCHIRKRRHREWGSSCSAPLRGIQDGRQTHLSIFTFMMVILMTSLVACLQRKSAFHAVHRCTHSPSPSPHTRDNTSPSPHTRDSPSPTHAHRWHSLNERLMVVYVQPRAHCCRGNVNHHGEAVCQVGHIKPPVIQLHTVLQHMIE